MLIDCLVLGQNNILCVLLVWLDDVLSLYLLATAAAPHIGTCDYISYHNKITAHFGEGITRDKLCSSTFRELSKYY